MTITMNPQIEIMDTNTGEVMIVDALTVSENVNKGTITVKSSMPYDLQLGDAYTISVKLSVFDDDEVLVRTDTKNYDRVILQKANESYGASKYVVTYVFE